MVGCSRGGGGLPAWMTAAAARVDLSSAGGGGGIPGSGASSSSSSQPGYSGPHQQAGVAGAAADQELGMAERALSAAGAAFVSAIIVNPLDVAKVGVGGLSLPPRALVWLVAESFFVFFFFRLLQTRLQAQAAGVPYYQPSQMASLGPDAVTNLMISMRVPCGWFAI